MSTIESLRDDGQGAVERARCDRRARGHEPSVLELAPPPEPECDCRAALRRLLGARDRYLVALGDGAAPFHLPEEDEYLASLAAARDLFAKS